MFTLFSNADFEGVEFYAARRYVHLTKEGREEDFFVNEGEEEEDEVLSFSPTPLVVEQRVGGVEFSDLTYLAAGKKSNLTYDVMAYLRRQDIAAYDNNNPSTKENYGWGATEGK